MPLSPLAKLVIISLYHLIIVHIQISLIVLKISLLLLVSKQVYTLHFVITAISLKFLKLLHSPCSAFFFSLAAFNFLGGVDDTR